MSTAIIRLTISLDRIDLRRVTQTDMMALAESELDGAEWWDGDYGYNVTVQSAEIVANDTRMPE